MGYTIAEKILAAHAGGKPVRAGDVVVASVDFAMLHDARASNALKMIRKLGVDRAMLIRECAHSRISMARCSTMSATASATR